MVFYSGFCTSISFWVGSSVSLFVVVPFFQLLLWPFLAFTFTTASSCSSVTASLAFLLLVWLQLNMSECFIMPCFTNHTPLLYTNMVINKRAACSYKSTKRNEKKSHFCAALSKKFSTPQYFFKIIFKYFQPFLYYKSTQLKILQKNYQETERSKTLFW